MLLEKLKALEAQAKAARKLAERISSAPAPSIHSAAKAMERQLSDTVQLNRHMHEIHCLAVELGLADAQPHRYGEKRVALGFGRETLDPRRSPATAPGSVETRTYPDGTTATGPAPLPDDSPVLARNATTATPPSAEADGDALVREAEGVAYMLRDEGDKQAADLLDRLIARIKAAQPPSAERGGDAARAARAALETLYHSLPDVLPAWVHTNFCRDGKWSIPYDRRKLTGTIQYRADDLQTLLAAMDEARAALAAQPAAPAVWAKPDCLHSTISDAEKTAGTNPLAHEFTVPLVLAQPAAQQGVPVAVTYETELAFLAGGPDHSASIFPPTKAGRSTINLYATPQPAQQAPCGSQSAESDRQAGFSLTGEPQAQRRLDALYLAVSRILDEDRRINLTRLHNFLAGEPGLSAEAIIGDVEDGAQQAREPMTAERRRDLVTNWFAEDWAVENALGLLGDYDRATPQAGQGGRGSMSQSVLDPCCGTRMMWADKADPRVVFGDQRRETITVTDRSHGNASGTRTLRIEPDALMDFRALPFPDAAFKLVAFDPPHLVRAGPKSWLAAKYGKLSDCWQDDLAKGFAECFRVLEPGGVLVFKWNETQVRVAEVLALAPWPPLFGHISGRKGLTHWLVFMKAPAPQAEKEGK